MVELNAVKYECPFCSDKAKKIWHSKGDREFTAHFPNKEEQDMLLNKKSADKCPDCKGTGEIKKPNGWVDVCEKCDGEGTIKKSLPARINEFVSKELPDEEADAKDKAEREKHTGGMKISCYFCGKSKYTNAKDPNKIKFECPKCRATSYRWEYIR